MTVSRFESDVPDTLEMEVAEIEEFVQRMAKGAGSSELQLPQNEVRAIARRFR